MNLAELKVDIVTAHLKESVFTERLEEHGVQFYELSGSQRNIVKNRRVFRNLLREQQYDVLYLNIFQGVSLYYAHLARKAGVPMRISHSHNTDLRQSSTRAIKMWLHHHYSKRYAKDATAFWACSQAAANFMFPLELLQERGHRFIPNGIDTEKFRFNPAVRKSVRRELGIADRFVIGNVGRLCYQKNQAFLLDVMVEALKIRRDCCLLLVGDGEDRQVLEEKARTLNIADHVIFYGTTSKVEELFWSMDVFAFPSRFEGLGIVAVEAQTAGLPVVCSEHVPEEAFVTGNARMVPLRAESACWAAQLLGMLRDANSCQVESVSQVKEAGFDINDVAEMISAQFVGGG